jgi:hypothetical protein
MQIKPSDTSLSFEINSNIEKVKEVPSFDNLVAYYPLSIGTNDGNAISDMSPNSNHGTNNGATFTEGVDGNINTGMKFDGVDDYTNLGSFDLTGGQRSISVWINSKNIPSSLSDRRFFSANYFEIKFVNSNLESWIYDTSFKTLAYSASILNSDTWYYIVITVNTNDLKMYVDGVLRNQNNTFTLTNHAYNLNIGSNYAGDSRFFNGAIDDVRIYNKVLTENEIKLLYNNKN